MSEVGEALLMDPLNLLIFPLSHTASLALCKPYANSHSVAPAQGSHIHSQFAEII